MSELKVEHRPFGPTVRVGLGFGFRVSGFGFRVSGFGFRVSGFGRRVSTREGSCATETLYSYTSTLGDM